MKLAAWPVALGLMLALVLASGGAGAQAPPNAKALESRLYAPCCYGGTLDIHESDVARDLRKEIESRVARGDAIEAIQADFVERYGDKVLAARSDTPARWTGTVMVGIVLLAAAALAAALRRWTRRTNSAERSDGLVMAGPATAGPVRDDLDTRIDDELADLDG